MSDNELKNKKKPKKKKREILVSQPAITAQILEMVSNPDDVEMRDLDEVLSADMGLVTRVLKLANSAAYSLPSQVEDLEQALILLGVSVVGEIALAASLEDTFKNFPEEVTSLSGEQLNEHSIAVARVAKLLSMDLKVPKLPQKAYVAGIMHDIGIVHQAWKDPEGFEKTLSEEDEQGKDFIELEHKYMKQDHCMIGKTIAQDWGLPSDICDAIGHHHNPKSSTEDVLLTNILHIADSLVGRIASHGMDEKTERIVLDILGRLGVKREDWDELMGNIELSLSI